MNKDVSNRMPTMDIEWVTGIRRKWEKSNRSPVGMPAHQPLVLAWPLGKPCVISRVEVATDFLVVAV
jgi:hypothetical protein